LTTTHWGATPGKLLAGLRVEDKNGQNLTLGRSLFRHTIGYWVSGLLWGLGYFWITRNPQKQGWHDQLTESFVVQYRRSRWPLLLVTLALLLTIDVASAASGVQKITSNRELRQEVARLRRTLEETLKTAKTAPEDIPAQRNKVENQSESQVKTDVRIEINQNTPPPDDKSSPVEWPSQNFQRQQEDMQKSWEQQQKEFEQYQKKSLEEFEKKKQENQQWFEQQTQEIPPTF
jgi:hypothetical protein